MKEPAWHTIDLHLFVIPTRSQKEIRILSYRRSRRSKEPILTVDGINGTLKQSRWKAKGSYLKRMTCIDEHRVESRVLHECHSEMNTVVVFPRNDWGKWSFYLLLIWWDYFLMETIVFFLMSYIWSTIALPLWNSSGVRC